MCGIVGIARRGAPADVAALHRMASAQAHRGPDGTGFELSDAGGVALGMNLLSIVGATAPGPYRSRHSGAVLTFNGEIYNWRELAQRWHLPILPDESDAHLLLRAWDRFGSRCLGELDGMFAFAVHEPRTERLVLVRDRLGEKPLYVHRKGGDVHFASEVKAISAAVPLTWVFPDEWHSAETPLGTDTPYEDLELIAPGKMVALDLRTWSWSERTWWDLGDESPAAAPSGPQLVERFSEITMRSLESRRGPGDQALLLSGGLDSAVIARVLRPEVLVTVRYPGHARYDELGRAEEVAASIGRELIVVEPTEDDLVDSIDHIVASLDYPVGNASLLSEFMLYRRIGELGIRVVHGGIGPDEFLLGYTRHALAAQCVTAASAARFGAYEPLARRFATSADLSGSIAERYYRGILRGSDPSGVLHRLVHERFAEEADVGRALTKVDLASAFPPLLLSADKLSSAFGLERRSPFLAHRWAQLCFSLPMELKCPTDAKAPTKVLLRQFAETVGVPRSVIDDHDKRGFASPVPVWLTTTLRAWAHSRTSPTSWSTAPARQLDPGDSDPYDRSRFMNLMISIWRETTP
ncbi:asparagine synthetase B [Curtobacterium luteum]|uniref:asparagine synthase (glutamine-hydrolyzing) n=2 Tax=Curtobacterium luteum TaxID=33881 RepID=A0A8H9G7M4_9MICO|nr:asparagine synthetase B [Curtobacterium luteum]